MATLTVGRENSADIDIYYEDLGAGSPVVLIHGWPLSGRSWENQINDLLAAGHRVITYDRRGFGKSSQPSTGYDYDTLSADLNALLDHLELTDVTLVGFSMGGGELARYVGRYGTDRISALVFAAAVPPYLYKSDANPDGAVDDALAQKFTDGITGDRIAFLDEFFDDFFSAEKKLTGSPKLLVSDLQKAYAINIASWASPVATLKCVESFAMTDFRDDLTRIDVPTLVIHGDSDQVVPFEASGKRTAEAIPGAKLVVIDGGPHAINATHSERFNKELVDFIATAGSAVVTGTSRLDTGTDVTTGERLSAPEPLVAPASRA